MEASRGSMEAGWDAASPETSAAAIPAWITKSLETPTIGALLEKFEDWDFDVFALDAATNGRPLTVGAMFLFEKMGVLDKLMIARDKLAAYMDAIETGYVPANRFHNATHAADVMFTTHFFLKAPLLRDMTGALDKFAAVLAAAVVERCCRCRCA